MIKIFSALAWLPKRPKVAIAEFFWKTQRKTWYFILGMDAMPFSLKDLLLMQDWVFRLGYPFNCAIQCNLIEWCLCKFISFKATITRLGNRIITSELTTCYITITQYAIDNKIW